MSFESIVYGVLSPVFGTEVYPIVHPDPDGKISDVASIYAIYHKIGGVSFNKLDGDSDMSRPLLQVSIYSIDFDVMLSYEQATATAMRAASLVSSAAVDAHVDPMTVSGGLPNVSASVPTHGYEADSKRFYSHMQFRCWARS